MRRIKSAPANICLMTNNKKSLNEKDVKDVKDVKNRNNIISFIYSKNSNTNNKFKNLKILKNTLSSSSDIFIDSINDISNFNLEETSLLYAIITYLSNNILKKDKIKELYKFFIQMIVKYFIMLIIHTQILHDKTFSIDYIFQNLHNMNENIHNINHIIPLLC